MSAGDRGAQARRGRVKNTRARGRRERSDREGKRASGGARGARRHVKRGGPMRRTI